MLRIPVSCAHPFKLRAFVKDAAQLWRGSGCSSKNALFPGLTRKHCSGCFLSDFLSATRWRCGPSQEAETEGEDGLREPLDLSKTSCRLQSAFTHRSPPKLSKKPTGQVAPSFPSVEECTLRRKSLAHLVFILVEC